MPHSQRKKTVMATLVLAVATLLATPHPGSPQTRRQISTKDVQQMMTSLSNWGRWGREDEKGTLNLITAQKQKEAAALVREGFSVSLGRSIGVQAKPPFEHKVLLDKPKGSDTGSSGDYYGVAYHGYALTHFDALCHLFHKGKMYNGFSDREVTEKGAGRLSVMSAKNGVFSRGVLIDIPRLKGVPYLKGATAIYPEDLDAWEKQTNTKVTPGDVILIRTGRGSRFTAEGQWDIESNSAGLHASCLPWLKARDVAVIGSDLATDVMPSGIEGFRLPVHWVAMVAMGTNILDNCELEALSEAAAARGRWDFLFTVAPLTVEGGTGSPINPIAVF